MIKGQFAKNLHKGGKSYGSNLRYPYCKGQKDDQ